MGESGVKRQRWGSQQRIQSNDFNSVSDLSARALIETTWAMSFGDAYRAIAAGVGGVVGGFMVQAVPGTQNVVVSPGLALIPHAQANPATDSPMVWIQSDASETLDLSALVDPTNPRLVTIEISADLGVTFVSENRGKIDPLTGVYSTASFDIIVGGRPTYHATAGTAAASPVVATGTAGRIPLAVVKLTAAQATFADAYLPVLLCRPLVAALGGRLVPPNYVRGGGVSVGRLAGAIIGEPTVVTIHSSSMSMRGLEADVSGMFDAAVTGRTPDGKTIGGLTTSVQPVYVYAATPPWADDYGEIAIREAWQRNPNALSLNEDYSVVNGEGATFLSLYSREPTGVSFRNAIPFFDTEAPVGFAQGLLDTAPTRITDARGPHPETAAGGSGAITLDDSQDPTWGPNQEVTETVYLGALASIGTGDFVAQVYDGHGLVRITDDIDKAGVNRRPYANYTTNQSASIYPRNWPTMLVGDDPIFPAIVASYDMFAEFTAGTGNGTAVFVLSSPFGYGRTDDVNSIGAKRINVNPSTVGSFVLSDEWCRVKPSNAGVVELTLTVQTGTELDLGVTAYTDSFLAAR